MSKLEIIWFVCVKKEKKGGNSDFNLILMYESKVSMWGKNSWKASDIKHVCTDGKSILTVN